MPAADRKPKTLYDKVLDHHIVNEQDDGTILLYIGMEPLCNLTVWEEKEAKKLTSV